MTNQRSSGPDWPTSPSTRTRARSTTTGVSGAGPGGSPLAGSALRRPSADSGRVAPRGPAAGPRPGAGPEFTPTDRHQKYGSVGSRDHSPARAPWARRSRVAGSGHRSHADSRRADSTLRTAADQEALARSRSAATRRLRRRPPMRSAAAVASAVTGPAAAIARYIQLPSARASTTPSAPATRPASSGTGRRSGTAGRSGGDGSGGSDRDTVAVRCTRRWPRPSGRAGAAGSPVSPARRSESPSRISAPMGTARPGGAGEST